MIVHGWGCSTPYNGASSCAGRLSSLHRMESQKKIELLGFRLGNQKSLGGASLEVLRSTIQVSEGKGIY